MYAHIINNEIIWVFRINWLLYILHITSVYKLYNNIFNL